MKLFLLAVLLAASLAPAHASDVGVSISLGQPGFYGQVNVGGYPPPQLLYRQPRLIRRGPVMGPPIYMNVPPRHAGNWRRYCGAYNACNQRVYFVHNRWYRDRYVPMYQQRNLHR